MASGTPDYQTIVAKLKSVLTSVREVANPIIWPKNVAQTQPNENSARIEYQINTKGSISMIYMRYKVTGSSQDEENAVIRVETDDNVKLEKRLKTLFLAGDYTLNTNTPVQLHKYDTANKIYEFTLMIPFTFDTKFKITLLMPAANGDTYELDTLIVFNADGTYTTAATLFTGFTGVSDEGDEEDSGTGETFDI